FSDEHRLASNDETSDEPCAQEFLNGDPTVDVKMMSAAGGELPSDLSRSAGHLFNSASDDRGQIERAAAQDHHALVAIRPRFESENGLESLAADHERIDACEKLVVAVGFAAALGQKVEIAVRPSNEPVEAGADKDRYRHRRVLTLAAAHCWA